MSDGLEAYRGGFVSGTSRYERLNHYLLRLQPTNDMVLKRKINAEIILGSLENRLTYTIFGQRDPKEIIKLMETIETR